MESRKLFYLHLATTLQKNGYGYTAAQVEDFLNPYNYPRPEAPVESPKLDEKVEKLIEKPADSPAPVADAPAVASEGEKPVDPPAPVQAPAVPNA
jgi:hypothetical protein